MDCLLCRVDEATIQRRKRRTQPAGIASTTAMLFVQHFNLSGSLASPVIIVDTTRHPTKGLERIRMNYAGWIEQRREDFNVKETLIALIDI